MKTPFAHLTRVTVLVVALLVLVPTVVVAAAVVVPNTPKQSGDISGALWVVSPSQAASATFPAPTVTPDATFSVNGIAFIGGSAPGVPDGAHCYTIEKFLDGCNTTAFNLAFSGLPNPNLGGEAAGPNTGMGDSKYGIMIEFNGTVYLTNGQQIQMIHDDGVSLMIDGNLVSGFTSGITNAYLQSVTWTGTTGTHNFTLLYANWASGHSDGAWMIFIQRLY